MNRITASIAGIAAAAGLGASVANAADLYTPTRNWGGVWFGFGAGYSNSSTKSDFATETCVVSTQSSGAAGATGGCTFSPDSVAVSTAAGNEGMNGASAAAAAADNTGAASASAAAVGVDGASAEAEAEPSGASATATADGTPNETTSIANSDPAPVFLSTNASAEAIDDGSQAQTFSEALADTNSGFFGAYSRTTVTGPSGNAEAVAFGFGGLPNVMLADDQGSLSPSIHMRMDHQTEGNFVFGGEIDLVWTPNHDRNQLVEESVSVNQLASVMLDQSYQIDVDALASARARLGYAMGDYLVYATGGLAWADFTASSSFSASFATPDSDASGSGIVSKSKNAFGGVVGGGVSAFVSDNTVVSLEGLYYMFDETINLGEGASATLDDAYSVMMKVSIRPN